MQASVSAPRFHYFVTLTARPATGEPVTSAAWFAAQGGKLYARLAPDAPLLALVRQGQPLTAQPSNRQGEPRGLAVAAMARTVPQFETDAARRAFDRKYGLASGMTQLLDDDQGLGGEVWLEITPDSGPGADDLLLEAMPATQRQEQRKRSLLMGAAGIGLGGLALAFARLRKRDRAA